MEKKSNRRSNFLINKNFQYRYVLLAVSIIIIVVNAFVITSLFILGTPTSAAPPWPEIASLATLELAVLGAVIYFGIRESHAIAGPMFVISRSLQRIQEGDLSFSVSFREKDHFRDVAEELNKTILALRKHLEETRELASQVQAAAPPNSEVRRTADQLLEHLQTFRLNGHTEEFAKKN